MAFLLEGSVGLQWCLGDSMRPRGKFPKTKILDHSVAPIDVFES